MRLFDTYYVLIYKSQKVTVDFPSWEKGDLF